MKQHQMFSLTFEAPEPENHVDVQLQAVFRWREADGAARSQTVRGFYAGGKYEVRFLPQVPGEYQWSITGCVSGEGTTPCAPAGQTDHGVVRTQGTAFVHEDGTPFLPFGTTVYALAHQEESLIAQTLDTLKDAPFNKVRLCVFPKHYDYNHNEPELFPFEKDPQGKWDVKKPCFAFWNHFEAVLNALAALGIQSDVILFHPYDRWGFSTLTQEECLVYLDYTLRRLSAMPSIWWSLANEFDLMFGRTMEDWQIFEAFVAQNDPYQHLLSNHNCFGFYDFTRAAITHCSMQTTQVESAGKWLVQYGKPLVYDECCYEGDLPFAWGNISAFEMVNRFWIACVQGAYATHGEVYLSEEEVLWWAKGGTLKGQSPQRIAFLRGILESLPCQPQPWEMDTLEDLPPEFQKAIRSGVFAAATQTMKEAQRESNFVKEADYRSRCGDEIFLQYLARHCSRVLTWKLPTEKNYRIDVIDVWEMTRQTVLENASGKVRIPLPGKEGIAVIASRNV